MSSSGVRAWFVHPVEHRLRAPFRLAILATALVVIGVTFALLPFRGETTWTVQTVAFSAATLAVGRLVDRRRGWLRTLGLDRTAVLELVAGAAIGVGLIGGVLGVEVGLGLAEVTPAPTVDPLALVVGIVLFASIAVGEELLFRAYLLTNLAEALMRDPARRARAGIGALAISSIVFGLAHATNPHATPVAVANVALAGVLLGLPFVRTGRLGVSIGIHFGWNLAQSLADMPVSGQEVGAALVVRTAREGPITGGAFGPEGGLTGLVAIALGTALALALVTARPGPPSSPALGAPPDQAG